MFPPECLKGNTKQDRYIYVDNQSPILLVAHIDTVISPRLDCVNKGAGFDDRLGVYAAHHLCKDYPNLFDLLLTDYEESSSSTAEYFSPSHKYNVVLELDREGEDYVDYQLASNELNEQLSSHGFTKGWGTFSDICFMDHIKCNKVNIGLGTYHSHSPQSGFNVGVYYRQIARIVDFAKACRDMTWPTVEPYKRILSYSRDFYDRNLYSRDFYGDYIQGRCEWCDQMFDTDELVDMYDSIICLDCAQYLYGNEITSQMTEEELEGYAASNYQEDFEG